MENSKAAPILCLEIGGCLAYKKLIDISQVNIFILQGVIIVCNSNFFRVRKRSLHVVD